IALSDVRLARCTAALVELEVDGTLLRFEVDRAGDVAFVDGPLGSSELIEVDRFPTQRAAHAAGSLLAPMPGTIVRVNVSEGDEVADGDELVVLEAMKMEHRVLAPHAGRVAEIRVRAGETVEAGVVLVVIDGGGETATDDASGGGSA